MHEHAMIYCILIMTETLSWLIGLMAKPAQTAIIKWQKSQAVPISISVARSQTPAYTVRSQLWE